MKSSIQYKILFSFSIVIFLVLASLIFVLQSTVDKNNEKVLNNEMIQTKKDLDVYLKQYFLINNMEANKTAFKVEGNNISQELSYKVGSNVVIYDKNGKIISDFANEYMKVDNSDLKRAIKGDIAYAINYMDNKVIVNLSYTVKGSKNDNIGIVRYSKDYTQVYNSNENIIYIVKIFSISMFLLIFVISFIISKQITKPIIELTNKSVQISKGNLDVDINIKSKDEVGQLGDNFKHMVEKIKSQINIIKRDRDALKEITEQKKIFFDNVTHELKTPITTILGYGEILKENGFTDKEFFEKGVSCIISESERLNRMVVELLELSKATSQDFTYYFSNIDFTKLIKNTCEEMNIKAKKYNILIKCLVEDNVILNGDNDKLKEMLVNILDNSIKYGNVNSTISVEMHKKNEVINLKIKDEGQGIPKEHLENIFQPFYRVSKKKSREKGSSGLGLAITKAIVEKHEGTIDIKSELGKGTTVNIKVFQNTSL
ncbi:ATP-binding protein [Haloimpatiens sp. FM7330]|uniref:ATP-binding protein n=1 Tax=Haloimpatiens sp. FM7330 TaxID=3298610 RepID=UPI003635FB93